MTEDQRNPDDSPKWKPLDLEALGVLTKAPPGKLIDPQPLYDAIDKHKTGGVVVKFERPPEPSARHNPDDPDNTPQLIRQRYYLGRRAANQYADRAYEAQAKAGNVAWFKGGIVARNFKTEIILDGLRRVVFLDDARTKQYIVEKVRSINGYKEIAYPMRPPFTPLQIEMLETGRVEYESTLPPPELPNAPTPPTDSPDSA